MIRGWFTVAYQPNNQPKWEELRSQIMTRNDPSIQAKALEQLLLLSYSESIPPHLLMPIVQYTATSKDHRVIKLLLLFLESIETRTTNGDLRPEFVLIIDAIRNMLISPNEYVRVASLRFLQKVQDKEIISQLQAVILKNLEHSNPHVRNTAAILCGRIASELPDFIPDLSEPILDRLHSERPTSSQSFSGILYAASCISPIETAKMIPSLLTTSPFIRLSLLHVLPIIYQQFPQHRVALLEAVIELCDAEEPEVRLEASNCLHHLSNSPGAIFATASAYCELLHTLVDETARSAVFQSLSDMISSNPTAMAPLSIEIAAGAFSPSSTRSPIVFELLYKIVRLVTPDNAISLISLIASKDIASIDSLSILLLRFPSIAVPIAEAIGQYVPDSNAAASLLKDCAIAGATREAFKFFAAALELSSDPHILSKAIWAVAEFAESPKTAVELLLDYAAPKEQNTVDTVASTVVNQDGTYSVKTKANTEAKNLRTILQSSQNDHYIALVLISAIAKLYNKIGIPEATEKIRKLRNTLLGSNSDKNSSDLSEFWIGANSDSFKLLQDSGKKAFENKRQKETEKIQKPKTVPADEPMQFTVLLNTAEAVPEKETKEITLPVIQLTGPSDFLYIEASCSLKKFDRLYHFTMYNRTENVLTNVLVEFSAVGAISIMKRNESFSIPVGGYATIDATVMISAGSCGTLFGVVSFDFAGAGGSDHQFLPLSPIDIDPFFCFNPVEISQAEFREKWEESVWERKIDFKTEETDLIKYLNNVASKFKFGIVTPRQHLEVTARSAGFITANLFTRSLFGEEVEMNISAKKGKDETITGFLRLRSQNEQIAFIFGKLIQ